VIAGEGSLGGVPILVEWQAGPLDDRGSDAELRWPIAATAELGNTKLTMTGRLRAPMAFARSRFDLQIVGAREGFEYSVRGNVRIDADSVLVGDLNGSFVDGGLSADAIVESGHLSVRRGERIEAGLSGTLSGAPFELSSRLGRLADVLDATQPWPLNFAAKLGDAGIELAAQLELDSNRAALRDLSVSVAGTELTGALLLTGSIARPRIDGELNAASVDLSGFAQGASAANARPMQDRELPLAWLDSADASVALEVGELRGLPVAVRDVRGTARLMGGVLELVGVEAEIAGLDLTGNAGIRSAGEQARFDLELRAAQIDLRTVLEALGVDRDVGLTGSVGSASVVLSTKGRSIRSAIAASDATLIAGPVVLTLAGDAAPFSATLQTVRVDAVRGEPLRLETNGRLAARIGGQDVRPTFELAAVGGTLPEWVAAPRPSPRLQFSAAGGYRGAAARITGRIGDTAALLTRAATDAQISATWGPLRAEIEGAVVAAPRFVGTAVDLTLSTDDLAAAGELLAGTELPAGSSSFAARASIGDQEWTLTDVIVTAPEIAGTGELRLRLDGRPTVQGRLQLAAVDLTPYVTARGPRPQAPEPSTPLALHQLYSSEPLDLAGLRRSDLDLGLTVETLRFGTFVTRDASLQLSAVAGALGLDAVLDGGRMSANASVDARTDAPDFTLRVSAAAVPLAADRTGVPAEGTAVVDLSGALAGHGASSRALVESLDGDLLIYLRGGRIQGSGLRFLFGAVLYQLLDVINPFSDRKSYVDIECAGAYFNVLDGVVSTAKGIVMQTREVQIVGVGDANFATGELTMRFRTKPRTGVVSLGGIVNEFVELTGTLDAPRVEISPERAARTGILAIVTGGLSLLATDLFARMTAKDACPELPIFVGAPGAAAEE
jgi:uncharacterized protein involved in outer membrane biogenesis